ncbi:hypothetical protein ACQ4M4_02270 [Leptolyngbya sp. AN02str]|uniref:hypothetical protein n=1 Tax=Leptolyngbya sp. AN02str TaxID=3423363 RepID=UPI003D31D744
MTRETNARDAHEFASTLMQAATTFHQPKRDRPSAEAMVQALLATETQAKQERRRYPSSALQGQWRLCFTTGVRKRKQGGIRLGNGFYMPKFSPAYIGFHPALSDAAAEGSIRNQIQLGGLKLTLTGPCRYLDKKNLLAFDFTDIHITLLGQTLYQGGIRGGAQKTDMFAQTPIGKLPFFAFFEVSDRYIAARGRGGGLALWIKE